MASAIQLLVERAPTDTLLPPFFVSWHMGLVRADQLLGHEDRMDFGALHRPWED